MKLRMLAMVIAAGLVPTPALSQKSGTPVPKYLAPTDELVTPHIRWDKPSQAGPLRVLFIVPRLAMREVVEFSQRFDLRREVFCVQTEWEFAIKDKRLAAESPGLGEAESTARLRDLLGRDYDCLVVGNAWACLPAWAQDKILDKVAAGTGLVARVPFGAGKLQGAVATPAGVSGRDVLGAFPYSALPAYRSWADFDSFFAAAVRLARHGKGRVALVTEPDQQNYLRRLQCDEPNRLQFLTPEIADPFPAWAPIHYDYYLALAGKLMAWCGGQEPAARVLEPASNIRIVERERLSPITFAVASKAAQKLKAELVLRTTDSGKVLVRKSQPVELKPGENAVAFSVPRFPAGRYFADLWLRHGDATVDFGSLHIETVSASRIKRVRTSEPSFRVGSPVRARVTLAPSRAGTSVALSQRDNFGRLVARSSRQVTGGRAEEVIDFEWIPPRPLTVLQFLEVELRQKHEVIDTATAAFTVNDLLPDRQEVRWVVTQSTTADSYLTVALARMMRQAGVDTWVYGASWDNAYLRALDGTPWRSPSVHPRLNAPQLVFAGSALRGDLRLLPMLYRTDESEYDGWVTPRGLSKTPTRHGYARRPCLRNPGHLEHCRRVYQEAAARLRHFSVGECNLGDECNVLSNSDQADVCFCDRCVEEFRQFVRRQYGTIERLNAVYGTAYKSFAQVVPPPADKIKDSQQIPAWIDHRRRMEDAWAGYFRAAREAIEEVLPGAKVGYEGSDDAGHLPEGKAGLNENYFKLARAMTLNGTYYDAAQLDAVRDFSPRGAHIGGGFFGGYGAMWRAGRDELHHRWWIWNTLLRGANAVWTFEGYNGVRSDGYFDVVAPDFTFYDHFRADIEEMRRVKAGLGKLLLTSRRPDDGLAVLYSKPSMLLAAFTKGLPGSRECVSAASYALTEAGFQYRFLAAEELDQGLVNRGRFRALYLPYCQAISPAGVKEILRFADAGGTVIADLRPGVADDHGKPYASGALDALFGVRQDVKTPAPGKASLHIKQGLGPVAGKLPEARVDGSLRLDGGRALAVGASAPALVVHTYGKGNAVLFNLAVSDWMIGDLNVAARFADSGKAAAARALFRFGLARAGLKPEVQLEPDVPGCHVWRHHAGAALVLGLLWDAPAFLPGVNWHDPGKVAAAAKEKRTVVVRLPRRSHVYDVFGGKYLGETDAVERVVVPGVLQLLAALPARVSGTRLELSATEVEPGDTVEFTAAMEAAKGSRPVGTVFRVEWTDPEGKAVPPYALNLAAPQGRARGALPLALDDKPGQWTVTVRDVLTGASARANFVVKEGG